MIINETLETIENAEHVTAAIYTSILNMAPNKCLDKTLYSVVQYANDLIPRFMNINET